MMTEPPTDAEAPPDPQPGPDPVELLIRAVGHLDPADRDRVYAWLLRRDAGPSAPAVAFTAGADAPSRRHAWVLNPELRSARLQVWAQENVVQGLRGSPSSAQQMVPVRFSTDQHAQLREWCAEHGFSMATVIRGLVARFLEGQLPSRT
jgi:hypothetical protein